MINNVSASKVNWKASIIVILPQFNFQIKEGKFKTKKNSFNFDNLSKHGNKFQLFYVRESKNSFGQKKSNWTGRPLDPMRKLSTLWGFRLGWQTTERETTKLIQFTVATLSLFSENKFKMWTSLKSRLLVKDKSIKFLKLN